MGAREVGPWVGEQKPLGKTPLGATPGPEMTYLPYLPGCEEHHPVHIHGHDMAHRLAFTHGEPYYPVLLQPHYHDHGLSNV